MSFQIPNYVLDNNNQGGNRMNQNQPNVQGYLPNQPNMNMNMNQGMNMNMNTGMNMNMNSGMNMNNQVPTYNIGSQPMNTGMQNPQGGNFMQTGFTIAAPTTNMQPQTGGYGNFSVKNVPKSNNVVIPPINQPTQNQGLSQTYVSKPVVQPTQPVTQPQGNYASSNVNARQVLQQQQIQQQGRGFFRNVAGLFRANYDITIPEGYELRHTAYGEPYYHKLKTKELKKTKKGKGEDDLSSDEENEDENAENEWKNKKKPNLFSRLGAIEKYYGIGIRLYFDFTIIILVFNVIFFLIQLGPIIFNFFAELNMTRGGMNWFLYSFANFLTFFFSSHWDYNISVWVWRITNLISSGVSLFLVAPVYYLIVTRFFRKRKIVDLESHLASQELDLIKENKDVSKKSRICRIMVSYTIFLVLLIILMVVIISITILRNFSLATEFFEDQYSNSDFYIWMINLFMAMGIQRDLAIAVTDAIYSFGSSILVSIVLSILTSIWKQFCGVLTKFEKHRTYSQFRKHHLNKLMFFKLSCAFGMGLFKGLFSLDCILDQLGSQYLVLLLSDMIINNFFELVIPLIKYAIKAKKIKKDSEDYLVKLEKIKPDFDVSEEYLELCYRQYIIYAALPSFPYISLLAVFSSFIEIIIDKIKLLYMSKRPPRTQGSVKTIVAFYLLLVAFLAIINPGCGTIYTLLGFYWCPGVGASPTASKICPIMYNNPNQCINWLQFSSTPFNTTQINWNTTI